MRLKHGGEFKRVEFDPSALAAPELDRSIVALDEALTLLSAEDPVSAEVVKLRYFAGCTNPEAAEALGVSPRQADFLWAFARAWLRQQLERD